MNLKSMMRRCVYRYRFKKTGNVKPYVNERLEYIKEDIRSRKIIWHVCTPKSASTYLMNLCRSHLEVLNDPVKYRYLSSVPVHGNRPQVTCPYTLYEGLKLLGKDTIAVTKHQHVLATQDLLELLSENHKVIVQTRTITDTLVSMVDHIDQSPESRGPWLIRSVDFWKNLDKKKKFDLLILHYVPWHIQFLQGWIDAQKHFKNIHLFDFDEIVHSPRRVFEEVFEITDSINLNNMIPTRENARFNRGVSGRGMETLENAQIALVRNMLEISDRLGQQLVRYL